MFRLQGPAGSQRLIWRANVALPGLYAWLETVVVPSWGKTTPPLARGMAIVALLALIAGVWLAPERPKLGRRLGLFGFVGSCTLTWVLLGDALDVERLEPVRACLGGMGWMLFALGWGAVRMVGTVPEDNPNVVVGSPLRARGILPVGANWVLGLAVVGGLIPVALAWGVTRPAHALFAHAVAILCATGMMTSGAIIAVERERSDPHPSLAIRLRGASRPLSLLVVALAAGLLWRLLQ